MVDECEDEKSQEFTSISLYSPSLSFNNKIFNRHLYGQFQGK